jgi:2-(1,2-epoxy-1,2-dihydrophenyl)acetyl-CoA isomerase
MSGQDVGGAGIDGAGVGGASPGNTGMAGTTVGDVVTELVTPAVAVIRMNRPPANYFDVELLISLRESIEWALGEGARAGVLAAAGKHFCAGMNFGAGGGLHGARLYEEGSHLFETDLPLVAAVRGSAIGGGLGLAMVADVRVAGESTRFWGNFTRLGLHHGFGLSVTLAEVVGLHRARELLMTGRPVHGPEALSIGLCDRLVADAEIEQAAGELATEIAAAAPLAVRSVRRTMRAGLAGRVRAAIERELAEQTLLIRTDDFREGVRAGKERRQPNFTGR